MIRVLDDRIDPVQFQLNEELSARLDEMEIGPDGRPVLKFQSDADQASAETPRRAR